MGVRALPPVSNSCLERSVRVLGEPLRSPASGVCKNHFQRPRGGRPAAAPIGTGGRPSGGRGKTMCLISRSLPPYQRTPTRNSGTLRMKDRPPFKEMSAYQLCRGRARKVGRGTGRTHDDKFNARIKLTRVAEHARPSGGQPRTDGTHAHTGKPTGKSRRTRSQGT